MKESTAHSAQSLVIQVMEFMEENTGYCNVKMCNAEWGMYNTSPLTKSVSN